MEIIKFDRIVSVNNELQGHNAQNILNEEISPNKNWMCEKGTEKAVVILQLERAVVLTSIHVGNAHSAFVEILVGKAADSSGQFESLVPMSIFMNPQESKMGTNPNRTRFFNKKDFNEAARTKSWDRIKVVCSQPFNKYVPYGLCFLRVHGEKEVKKAEVLLKTDDTDEIQIGSFFKKRSSHGDKPLTESEQITKVEKEACSLVKHVPISTASVSEKLSSRKKPETNNDEEGEKKKRKSEEKIPKKKKEESTTDESTPKRKKNKEKEEKPIKGKAEKKTEEKMKTPKEKQLSEKKRRKKSFDKLMEDVVLVISGFKNPLRGDIRSMALRMGAKYSADWEPHCTHLVCAYENTPKCRQVKGKGKIVKKDWVEKCHKDRKRYPWRRFALDKDDLKKVESEEEIDAGEESEPEEQVASSSKSDENVGRNSPEKSTSDYDRATDDEEENDLDTTEYPMPHLPDIFSLKTFYVDPNLPSKATLERYIVAYNGVLADDFHEGVNFYISDKGGTLLELFRKKVPNLVPIKPSWIWEINSKEKYIPTTQHLVN